MADNLDPSLSNQSSATQASDPSVSNPPPSTQPPSEPIPEPVIPVSSTENAVPQQAATASMNPSPGIADSPPSPSPDVPNTDAPTLAYSPDSAPIAQEVVSSPVGVTQNSEEYHQPSDSLVVPPPTEPQTISGVDKNQTTQVIDNGPGSSNTNGKKKSKTAPIIAVILLLLVTLPIGIFYVSQRSLLTEIRSLAGRPGPYPGITNRQQCLDAGGEPVSEPGGDCGEGGYRNECKLGGHWYFIDCGNNPPAEPPEEPPTGTGTPPTPTPTRTPTPTPMGTLTPTPTGNPTPTPTPSQCVNIIAVKDGEVLSSSDLAALHVGDTITLKYAPGSPATSVRFQVNDGGWNVVTAPGADGYYSWDYTLEDATNFSIEAQWFDGSIWQQ